MESLKEVVFLWRNDEKRRDAVSRLTISQLLGERSHLLSSGKGSFIGNIFMKGTDLVGAVYWGMSIGRWINSGDPALAIVYGTGGLFMVSLGMHVYRSSLRLDKLHTEIQRELSERVPF